MKLRLQSLLYSVPTLPNKTNTTANDDTCLLIWC